MTDSQNHQAEYRVLARKYRPNDFEGLIGQEAMVRTLRNSFASGRIAQAWMLTGVRGVGKTTTARILARGLNFESDSQQTPTVDLTEYGTHCEAIIQGRHVDVIEMDAASHTSIDDIKQIIDSARYAPVSARYKVYIIDEVHMISDKAFNALLKTLEEPPPHVKFIFATTEIRKVPVTILSRCQRFDLRRVETDVLNAHLASIAAQEGVAVEDEALQLISRAAEGSVRDSLSIMDQAIAYSASGVSAEQVRDMLGLADRARIITLFEALMAGQMADALQELRGQYNAGAEPVAILSDLATFNHLVTRMKFVPELREDKSLSQEEREKGTAFADGLNVRVLSRTWQMLLKGIQEVQMSNRQIEAAEMVLIRIAHSADLPTLDEALKSLSEGGAQPTMQAPHGNASSPTGGGHNASAVSSSTISRVTGGGTVMALAAANPAMQPDEAPQDDAENSYPEVHSFDELMALVDEKRDVQLKIALKNSVIPISISNGRFDLALTNEARKDLVTDLQEKLQLWTGQRWMITISNNETGQTLGDQQKAAKAALLEAASQEPDIEAILNAFPGAIITDVRLKDDS